MTCDNVFMKWLKILLDDSDIVYFLGLKKFERSQVSYMSFWRMWRKRSILTVNFMIAPISQMLDCWSIFLGDLQNRLSKWKV